MTYTDKYLIQDISNKAFKRKYGAKMGKKRQYNFSIRNKLRYDETWKQRILRINPWLEEPEPMFDSLQPEDQAHLDSIRVE